MMLSTHSDKSQNLNLITVWIDHKYFISWLYKGSIPLHLIILVVNSDSTCENILNSAFCQGIIVMIKNWRRKPLPNDRKILRELL